MNKILLSHFYGEMGWELFGFQALMRSLSEQYNKTMIISRPLNYALYADFATDFIPYTPKTNITNYAKCKDDLPEDFYDNYEYTDLIPAGVQLVHWSTSKGLFNFNDKYLNKARPKYIKFGRKEPNLGYDILLHCRSTIKLRSGGRNWGYGNWSQLVTSLRGYHIACIGTEDASLWIDGTDDMRGIGMGRLTDLMASSRLVVGTSSGPMHLSQLCGTPHLVISSKINRLRYLRDWAPFRTECIFVDGWGWKPPVEEIEKLIKSYFDKPARG